MFKNHKKALFLSSLGILLPILAGLLLWDKLPDLMVTHWGSGNVADGASGKAFAVFGLPLVMLGLQWMLIFLSGLDKRNREQNPKVMAMVLWIIPVVSWFVSALMYSVALERDINFTAITSLPLAILFIVLGNYMPKTKQNHTIGIKIRWTLQDEDNWNRTHRLAGKVWVVGGILMLFSIFFSDLGFVAILMLDILLMVLIPTLYSYKIYKDKRAAGQVEKARSVMTTLDKKVGKAALIITVLVLAGVAVLMFTGDIDVAAEDTGFSIRATYSGDFTVEYDAIDAMEYRTDWDDGVRIGGFGSPRLLMGNFKNEEAGRYTLYAYTRTNDRIVMYSGNRVLVFSAPTDGETRALYETLLEKIN